MTVYMQKKNIAFLFIILAISLFLIYFFLNKSQQPKFNQNEQHRSAYRTKMEGLSFLTMENGRKVIAIRADRFIVKNMKVGFFSFSMATVAALENAAIDIYNAAGNNQPDDQKSAAGVGRQSPVSLSQENEMPKERKNDNSLDFRGVLSKETFASFPAQNVTAIEAAPVVLTLYDDDKVLTQIFAQKAKVRFRSRDVLFEGDVRVVSGPRNLKSESLRLSPKDGLMEAEEYSRAEQGRMTSGKNLKTDLLLKRNL